MDEQTVSAPVVRVELFEDRASATRRVPVPTEPGRYHLVIDQVSPLLREVALSFITGGDILVEEARVERHQATRYEADTKIAAELESQRKALDDKLRRAESNRRRATESATRARENANAGRSWAPHALLRAEDPVGWLQALRALEGAATELGVTAAIEERELTALRDELAVVKERLELARAGRHTVQATLHLQLLVRSPGTLDVRYTVPCAVWRPIHRATLREARVHWEVGAMAWNATGEDWSDVELVCSTARPSERATPPVLTDDVVHSRRREKEVVVEARDEVIQVAREGTARRTNDVPGVDDGGEPRTFTAPGRVALTSDGRPVHILLERWEADATSQWVAHPEQASHVVLRSLQPNGATRPLLAGPVELYRDSGAVGRGQIGLVAPGEPFALGWGSHDDVRVTRSRTHKRDRARITGRQSHQFEVELRVAHLGAEPVTLTIRERVPVSEIKDVKITPPSATPALQGDPDADGICSWELTLEPGQTRTLSLDYTVEASSNVRLPW